MGLLNAIGGMIRGVVDQYSKEHTPEWAQRLAHAVTDGEEEIELDDNDEFDEYDGYDFDDDDDIERLLMLMDD